MLVGWVAAADDADGGVQSYGARICRPRKNVVQKKRVTASGSGTQPADPEHVVATLEELLTRQIWGVRRTRQRTGQRSQ